MKTRHRRRRKSPLVLFLVCVILASIIYLELKGSRFQDNDAALEFPQRQYIQSLPPEAEFVMPPLEVYSEIVARPLFSPLRRPPPPEKVDSETGDVKPSLFVLTGVIISAGGRMALLRRANVAGIIQISEGQEIDGWRVEAIKPDRVILRRGGIVEEVTLQDKVRPVPPQIRPRRRRENKS